MRIDMVPNEGGPVVHIELQMGRIHAVSYGEGITILVMHGGSLEHRHMLDAIEPVFDGLVGWRRVYIDLPGHGRSAVDDSVVSQDDVLN